MLTVKVMLLPNFKNFVLLSRMSKTRFLSVWDWMLSSLVRTPIVLSPFGSFLVVKIKLTTGCLNKEEYLLKWPWLLCLLYSIFAEFLIEFLMNFREHGSLFLFRHLVCWFFYGVLLTLEHVWWPQSWRDLPWSRAPPAWSCLGPPCRQSSSVWSVLQCHHLGFLTGTMWTRADPQTEDHSGSEARICPNGFPHSGHFLSALKINT